MVPRDILVTVQLQPQGEQTLLTWTQAFENPEAEKARRIVVPANEQNLDRLAAELARPLATTR